jgi:hypothetical protein
VILQWLCGGFAVIEKILDFQRFANIKQVLDFQRF